MAADRRPRCRRRDLGAPRRVPLQPLTLAEAAKWQRAEWLFEPTFPEQVQTLDELRDGIAIDTAEIERLRAGKRGLVADDLGLRFDDGERDIARVVEEWLQEEDGVE